MNLCLFMLVKAASLEHALAVLACPLIKCVLGLVV